MNICLLNHILTYNIEFRIVLGKCFETEYYLSILSRELVKNRKIKPGIKFRCPLFISDLSILFRTDTFSP